MSLITKSAKFSKYYVTQKKIPIDAKIMTDVLNKEKYIFIQLLKLQDFLM